MDNHSTIQLQCLEMTTKRKIMGRLVPCRCFRGEEEVISVLDYSHCSLQQVPKEIFSFERTLEELYLDANQIEELPKQLFSCQALRKLSMADNDLSSLPPSISSLVNLRELDVSKNGIQEFPDNIKGCKCLSVMEASVNPITKLPDGFTHLINLTQLFLNDAFLDSLPPNFGKLSKLRILELRENHLKTLPKSLHKLALLERLDLGSNEFCELPDVLEQIQHLKELWMDNNSLQSIPGSVGRLKHLSYLDLSKNRIESVDSDISGCEVLEDLLLSFNSLQQLPDSIGILKKLTTLKVDENQLSSLPNAIGSLSHLEEFDCSANELQALPPTIGYLHNLRTFAADENFLSELPREIGSCKNVTVMSLRSNKLQSLPEEIGQMTKLRVLNLSDNRLKNLPLSFTKLKDLSALWLSDNQSKALIPLQSEANPETKQRVLTNYMFPQQPRRDEDYQSDTDSFNPALWEEQRQQRMTVAFDFEEKDEEENAGKVKVEINLKRYPTPYPEDLKNMVKSIQNTVGKESGHALSPDKDSVQTSMELHGVDKYEHKWPTATVTATATGSKEVNAKVTDREAKEFQKTMRVEPGQLHSAEKGGGAERSEDSRCGSPNDIRISDMRPTLVEPPVYKPKAVILGKNKKESVEESDADKAHCLNTSGSSGPSSEYSPSQASTISSNPPGTRPAPPTTTQEATHPTHWASRFGPALPLLCQRETPAPGSLQPRPLSDTFDRWNVPPHYDNTAFVGEDSPSAPASGSRPPSASGPLRRPLLRQDRILGLPLDLEASPHLPRARTTPQVPPPPPTRWHNWTRTPSPLEDRTAFPSRPDPALIASSAPQPERDSAQLPGSFPSAADPWRPQDLQKAERAQGPSYALEGALVLSKSAERLQEGRGDPKAKFRKSQSIDEIDAAPAVYSIPLADAQDDNLPQPQPIPRSQSAPMLDDDTLGEAQSQGGGLPQGGYQTATALPFLGSPEGVAQGGRAPHRGGQRGYLPGEPLLSPVGVVGGVAPQGPVPRSRPGLLRRADSLVSSAELAVFRRAMEAQQQPQVADRSSRLLYRNLLEQQQGAPAPTPDSHYPRRDARYAGQEPKKLSPAAPPGYPTKSLPQRRPMSARSFSTEGFGGSQARPISARPSMAALLEKGPVDHTLSPCLERSGETELHLRSDVLSPHLRSDVLSPHLRSDVLSSHLRSDVLSSHLRSDVLSPHLRSDMLSPHLRSDVLSSHLRSDVLSPHLRSDVLSSHLRSDVLSPHLRSDVLSSHLRSDVLSSHLRSDVLSPHLRPDALSAHLRPDALSAHLRPDALSSRMPADWRQQVLRHIEAKRLDRGPFLEKEQDDLSPMSQWGPYALGRRDVPPESLIRKAGLPHTQAMMMSSGAGQSMSYEGVASEVPFQQYLPPQPTAPPTSSRPQSARCPPQTKGPKNRDGYQEQVCVRIEKSPGLGGLGFSISGGITGQGNPFRPSDMGTA
ncbi:leucine-rich repeat-containing protein 7-like isoform X2 [Conger conger]|uniref:leucine-rich repeat-containing protein 7-like isoform X2 n=1 Tax=Conger conger TaxID=82655 RepID=UPI002A5A21C5|nr:leucine-rich repeat-containing protein 7-like isoform X2 [Conger conger]